MLPISAPYDHSLLPTYPAPWVIAPGTNKPILVDKNGKVVSAAGVNTTGYANLPTTKSMADSWALKLKKLGVRVVRVHHVDVALQENPLHYGRLQLWLNALKSKGIPAIMEFASQSFDKNELAEYRNTSRWEAYVNRVCQMDLSNVVAACPVNEPANTDPSAFDMQARTIRSAGFSGLLFGSNTICQGGIPLDLDDAHVYCDMRESEGYFETYYNDQWWNHPQVSNDRPLIVTECGHAWPASTRGDSERQIVDICMKREAHVICMFALCTDISHWGTANEPLQVYAFHNDPERMETLRYLARKMAGMNYFPRVGNPGFYAEFQEEARWKIIDAS